MPRGSSKSGSRSRFGCTACRRKHRKCDEQRPVCRPCQTRGICCDYRITLKWTNAVSFGQDGHFPDPADPASTRDVPLHDEPSNLQPEAPQTNGDTSDNTSFVYGDGWFPPPHKLGPAPLPAGLEAEDADGSSFARVVAGTLRSLLLQIFDSPGEEVAFTYFFEKVSSCIPAHDSERNPWRKLSLVALSHPVLLHGILSVSTAHMINYGRGSEELLDSRQSRALRSLRAALDALRGDDGDEIRDGRDSGLPFSIASTTEVTLAAVMMQTSSVLMTGIGNVEMHMRCALHFIRHLGYLRRPPASVFPRTIVNRFAMVDVVLAHLRFRRPLAPPDFFMYGQSHDHDPDRADPPFCEMHGCPHRVLCFLARIAVLSADLAEPGSDPAALQAEAYRLETEMRIWGARYGELFPSSTSSSPPPLEEATPLDVVCECFYWTAHLLLMRRLLLDPTRSSRVQLVRARLFCLMDRLAPGCGPDSSLPFPFYMAAREAVAPADRRWVRRKHAAMLAAHRDRSRAYLMASTERIWVEADAAENQPVPAGTPLWDTPKERLIREMDREASYFMF